MPRNGSFTTERVTFTSEGETLVGTLYRPAGATAGRNLPGLLVSGSWTTVKEQMPGLYARRLAEAGFVALAFDFRNWGESTGEPRNYESPASKIRDFHNAAAYLKTVNGVDPDRVGALAICASTGYVAHAVAEGAPIQSLALVASWLHDPDTVGGFYGGGAGVRKRVEAGRAAAERYRREGVVDYVPAYDPNNPDAGMFFELDYYANEQRGRVPSWDNRLAVMSWPDWLGFDALSAAPKVRVPVLMVHSDGAALPDNARRFFDALPGPKHLLWTEGTQIDFYDQPAQVDRAVAAATAHFTETLGTPGRPFSDAGDRWAIADCLADMLHAVDARDWDRIRRHFSDRVRTDYTSLFGGEAAEQDADALIAEWRDFLPGFDSTQHLAGPLVTSIHGERASARCAITGVHTLGDAHWTVGGHYQLEFARESGSRWVIASLTLDTAFVQGDRNLPARAAERVVGPVGQRV